jgi:predicted nuclease with TOPRIM domain
LDESIVEDLHRKLSVKDDLLTETRLEALTSASQMQSLREQVAKLRTELRNVKRENDELKHKVRLTPTKNSFRSNKEEWADSSLLLDSSTLLQGEDALEIPVIIVIMAVPIPLEIRIGCVRIRKHENLNDSKTWRDLDMNVQCLFGLYLARLDPFECLGLSGTMIK